ncbi:MAG: ABC transporter ATP-binding protein [Clostridiales bacterium]|nr:ABC transporter ATP-binding protein [Clostridiales bacterium]MCI6613940.1 ABC transporter ATP-binding protein [Clostridiales bacterium]
MIEVRDLVKTFDGFAALRGATLTVPKGAVYGLVGPNGAGKSTLLRHITGVFRQDSGEVLVNGVPVYENRHVKENIVSIPDDWFYYNQSTIREMAALYAGLYPRFDWERFERLRELFQLPEKKTIRRMSKGMQRQAAFWITISCLPEYLVLDEPVDGLDPVMRRQVWQVLLDDVAARGTTVLLSSHNLRELEDVCDHVGIMDKGKVLLERTLSDLQDTTVKLQVAYKTAEEPTLPAELQILHHSRVGRVHTYIMRGNSEEICRRMQITDPVLLEAIPLTLEEIFIYELGGADDVAHKILV